MNNQEDKRDLGQMGENTLQLWASQVGITANPAKRDQKGWDYLLQFLPSDLQSTSPLDLRPGEINCLLQVKATGTKTKRISVKLRNWERFVKTQLPAFFLVLKFDAGLVVEDAYLIHIDKHWIEKVLGKLREITPNVKSHLNKKTLDLTWNPDNNRLQNPNGEGLEKAIRKYVGLRMDEYSKNKSQIIENSGDPIKALITITTKHSSEEGLWTDWIEFALGLRDGMKSIGMVVQEDLRFGIPAQEKKYETEGWFKFDPPTKDVKLVIKNKQENLISTFSAKVITPHYIFPGTNIPEKYFRARVIFQFGDLIIHPQSRTGTFNVFFISDDGIEALERKDTLKNLANSWRLAFILNEIDTRGCEIEISDDIGTTMKLQIFSRQKISEQILGFATSAECAWYIARYFDLPIETDSSVVELGFQFHELRLFRNILDASTNIEVFQADSDGAKLNLGGTYTIVFGQSLHFNQMGIFIRIALRGEVSSIQERTTGNEHFQIRNPIRIHADYRLESKSKHTSSEETLEELVHKFENKGQKVILIKSLAL